MANSSSRHNEHTAAEATDTRPTVRCWPRVMLAANERGEFAAVRLHTVLRGLDAAGRGMLPLATILARLADPAGDLYMASRRQIQTVLAAGEGAYWHRHASSGGDGRSTMVRLVGQAAILKRLDLADPGDAAVLPVQQLTRGDVDHGRQRQAEALAAVWECWHATRPTDAPMSHDAVAEATGLLPARQRRLDAKRVDVDRKPAIDITADYTDHKFEWVRQRAEWGPSLYVHTDWHGSVGPKGHKYIARIVGCRWTVKPAERPRSGRTRRRLKRAVARLRINGARGTGGSTFDRVHFATDRDAWKQAAAEAGRGDARPSWVRRSLAATACIDALHDWSATIDSYYSSSQAAAIRSL